MKKIKWPLGRSDFEVADALRSHRALLQTGLATR
jgi:hypothetical protein